MNQLEFDKSAHQLTIIDVKNSYFIAEKKIDFLHYFIQRNEKKLSLTENRLTFDLNSDANWGVKYIYNAHFVQNNSSIHIDIG